MVGHKNQWSFLVKAAEIDRLSHAYLFSGQDKLGKKKLAIEFIKFLNCSSQKRPCENCRSCQDIEKGNYPDLILIEPESSKGEIQISQMRELIRKLSLRAHSASFKATILDKAHLMTREAQSCFLKLLEEPKGRSILILITEYPEMLLSTILSRVQKIKFFPVKAREIENYLIQQGVSQNEAKAFCSFSFGKPGAAIDFVLDSQRLENQKKLISDLAKISNSDISFRFQYAKDLLSKEGDLREVLDTWLNCFRKIFLCRLRKVKTDLFEQYPLAKLEDIIKSIQSTNLLVSTTNVNPKLALEILLLQL